MTPTRRLPSLNALRAFEAVARRLSFARAADELFVTKAAIEVGADIRGGELGTAWGGVVNEVIEEHLATEHERNGEPRQFLVCAGRVPGGCHDSTSKR